MFEAWETESVWLRWEGEPDDSVYACQDCAFATELNVYETYQGPVASQLNWAVQEDAFLYFHDGNLIGASGPIRLWNFS